MRSGVKKTLEVALQEVAEKGPRLWPRLKVELVQQYGFAHEILEENHQDIVDMFLGFLERASNPEATIGRIPISTGPSTPSMSPTPAPRASSGIHSFVSMTPAPSQRAPEPGWIGWTERNGFVKKGDVTFCFGQETGNIIGQHIVARYIKELIPHIQDDEIVLICCLNIKPERTYDIKFHVEKSEDFDVCLGRHWKSPPDAENDSSSARKTKKERLGQQGPTPPNLPIVTSNTQPITSQMTPDFVASLTMNLVQRMSSPNQTHITKPAPKPRRRQEKKAVFDTDPEPKVPSKQAKTRAREPPWQSMTEEQPESIGTRGNNSSWNSSIGVQVGSSTSGRKISPIRRGAGRISDASFTSEGVAKIFDSDEYEDDESEESDYTSPEVAPTNTEALSPASSLKLALGINPRLQTTRRGQGYR